MRLGILTPSHGMMFSEADIAQKSMLIHTAYWMQKTFGSDAEIKLLTTNRVYLVSARAALLKAAIESECDWVLWLDDDMVPPKDMVLRLFEHNLPIVGAIASRKVTPSEPVAFRNRGGVGLQPVPHSDLKGLVEVDATGLANVLMKTEIMAQVLQASNGIPFQFIHGYTAEDLYFWQIVRALGHKLFIDCDIRVGHLGTKEYLP